jgi:hypothetical protein
MSRVLRLEERDSGTTPKKFIFRVGRRERPNPAVCPTGAIRPAPPSPYGGDSATGTFAIQALRFRYSKGESMNSKGAILIVFAWVMEAVGVTGGIINST